MLSFGTIGFLFRFLPIFLLIYCLAPKKSRNLILVLGSLVFYGFGSGLFVLLLLLIVLVNYAVSRFIYGMQRHGDSTQARSCYIIGMVFDFGLLILYRYLGIIASMLNAPFALVGVEFPVVQLNASPLGISFITFSATAYLTDVYRRTHKPARNIVDLAAHLTMFPVIAQGPICRYGELAPQLRKRRVNIRLMEEGLEQFTLGLAAKLLLANRMSGVWNEVGMFGYSAISTPYAWFGAVAYSFFIYFDFAGYSMMALGAGKMLGISLPDNFNLPYCSKSCGEFWRRWHMTMGRWFRDYIYIPMGGSRCKPGRIILNTLVVWAFTGFWHAGMTGAQGACWNFILWGLIFFVLLTLERFVYGKFLKKIPALGHCYVLLILPLTWIVFALTDLSDIGTYFARLFPLFSGEKAGDPKDFFLKMRSYWYLFVLCGIFSTPYPDRLFRKMRRGIPCKLMLVALFLFCAYMMLFQPSDVAFVYGNF